MKIGEAWELLISVYKMNTTYKMNMTRRKSYINHDD